MSDLSSLRDVLNEALQQPWTGFVVMKSADRKNSKNGSTYYRIALSDGDQIVAANIFEDRPGFPFLQGNEWRVGDHFKVQGRVSLHAQYGRQIELMQIRPVDAIRDVKDGYRPEKLMERAPIDLDVFWGEVQAIIAALEPAPLQATVVQLFEQHGDNFRRAAAAKQAHHAYYGGLMHHTVMMCREAQALMNVPDFPPMNRSLVLAAILMHDLGKTQEMEIYPRTEYTETGSLLGHTQLVLSWIDIAAQGCGFEGPHLLHLKHIILSHHGAHEFGAAVLPQTKEALLVHLVDNVDAKMQMVHFALGRLEGEGATEKLWAMENRSFRPSPQV